MIKEVRTQRVAGRRVIGVSDLTRCNTKYHRPYLGVLSPEGDLVWQEIVKLGYGKNVSVFYVIENLRAGDYIQCAGGSATNKYPFHGQVIEISDEKLVVEEIGLTAWSNLVADRRAAAQRLAAPNTADSNEQ